MGKKKAKDNEEINGELNKREEKKSRKVEKKTNRSKFSKIVRVLLLLLLIAGVIFGAIFTYRVAKNGWGLQGIIGAAMGNDENTLQNLERIYFLILGISGCEEDYKLADTIMVCSYDPKTQDASILSIPRDTYVGTNKKKATASKKINAVYQNGNNIQGMMEDINTLTGLSIKNYVIVDTSALRELVDAIGGVDFEVPIDMKYDDYSQDLHIDLKAGFQHLNGQQAEWLVRFRHSNNGDTYSEEYGDNDIGRMRTQREFITATLKQTLKPENLLKIKEISQIMFNNIKTNVNYDEVKSYIPYSVNFNAENLKTGTLPGTPELANKIWIYTVNKTQAKEVVQELFGIKEEEPTQENTNTIATGTAKTQEIRVEIQNATGSTTKLNKAIKLLEEKGYKVAKTGNTTSTSKTSIINRTNQSTEKMKTIKKLLNVGIISEKSNNSNVDITIILGKDYQ